MVKVIDSKVRGCVSPWSRGRINACQAFEPSSSLGGEKCALLAQLAAHRSDKAAVNGSIPLESNVGGVGAVGSAPL